MKIGVVLVFLALTSCISTHNGKILDADDINAVDVGLTSKENTIRLLGYPSFQSDFYQNRWIYYSYNVKRFLFFKPYFIDQKVLLIEFDDETDLVKKISFYNINTNEYEFLRGTNADTGDKDVIKDILNNIGTFNVQ